MGKSAVSLSSLMKDLHRQNKGKWMRLPWTMVMGAGLSLNMMTSGLLAQEYAQAEAGPSSSLFAAIEEVAKSEAQQTVDLSAVQAALALPAVNINSYDRFRKTALHQALSNGQYALASYLIDAGADPSLPDGSLQSALHIAIGQKQLGLASKMIATKRIEPNTFNNIGQTPLTLAIESGSVSLVKQLVAAGALALPPKPADLMRARGLQGKPTPLATALGSSRNNSFEIAKLLLDTLKNPRQILAQNPEIVQSALRSFKGRQLEHILPYLDVNMQVDVERQQRLIHGVVMSNSPKLIRTLLKAGADIDATDKNERTALMLAVRNRMEKSIRTLIQKKRN